MRRYFNTEGLCKPDKHYMVNLDERLDKIRRLYIDREKYFIINRGRQYGKTTTLRALAEYLQNDYIVISLDFQGISTEEYTNEYTFTKAFMRLFLEILERGRNDRDNLISIAADLEESPKFTMGEMFQTLSRICRAAQKPIVMIIDEVDSASNNQVFIDFLAQLRMYYLDRDHRPTFHSVVLAGVYDIKNLKLKIRPNEEHQYNSPWNIAAEFSVNMDFSVDQIAVMLQEYEDDNRTGMDVGAIAQCIYDYTSGYPYLVSAICKIMDEELFEIGKFQDFTGIWTEDAIIESVKILLDRQLPLFQSMNRQLSEYSELKQMLSALLFQGKRISFMIDSPAIALAAMFGYIVNKDGCVQVANRIFETRLYSYFLSEEELSDGIYDAAQGNKNLYIQNGRLNMELVMEKFVQH